MSYRGAIRLFVTLLVLLVTAVAAAAPAKEVPTFTYKFQIVAVTMQATFTKGAATAKTELHLSSLPKQKSLSWWGKKNFSNANGSSSALLRVAGTATYAGLDPACNGVVSLNSARWRPIHGSLVLINARDRVVTRPKISASAGSFPIASIYSSRSGGCENGAFRWWEGGAADLALRVLKQASFSFTSRHSETFEDGSAVEWAVSMKVRRVHYRPIDCARTPLC